jgi:type II secretory pathway component GspD/PulD (secretin)
MCMTRLIAAGFLGMALAIGGTSGTSFGQTRSPNAAPVAPATTTGSATTTRPKRPALTEVISGKKVDFDFEAATPSEVLDFMGKSFDVTIENAYRQQLTDILTIKLKSLGALEAVNIVNLGLQTKGYAVVPSVRTDEKTPRVALTVLQIKPNAGDAAPVFIGMDPSAIPEGNEMRTQIITVKNVDLEKYRDMITAVLGKQASININADTKTLMVTDTSTHVRSLVSMLQLLDGQGATGGK